MFVVFLNETSHWFKYVCIKCEHVRFLQDFIVWPKCPQTETAQTETTQTKTAQTESARPKSRGPILDIPDIRSNVFFVVLTNWSCNFKLQKIKKTGRFFSLFINAHAWHSMHQRLLMLAFYFGTGLFGLAVSVWAVSVRAVSVWAVSVWAVSVWAVSVWAVSVAGHSGLGTFRSRHFCT